MIQFLDEDIVYKHLDELTHIDYYFYLSRRFINKSWFKLDVEKLKNSTHINSYLFIMSQTPEGISAEEARQLLYQWIAVIVLHDGKNYRSLTSQNIFWRFNDSGHRVINVWGIDTALYYLLCMNHNDVVKEILEWDEKISRMYKNGARV